MIRVSSLKKGYKFRIVPVQDGISTWIDEVRFVEEMIENPLMLDNYIRANGYSLSPYGEKVIYKMLMNYAYSVLDLRGNDVKDFMFNTMRNVAELYHEMKMETSKSYREKQERHKKLLKEWGLLSLKEELHEYKMKRAFDDWDSYGVKVCYGCKTYREDTYKDKTYYETHVPLPKLESQKALNVWEFLKSVRPQTMAQDIVFYEDELQPILDLYKDDLHKLIIAFSMILRAKLFEQSRCYWDEKTVVDDVTGEVYKVANSCEGSHWNTPCITERKNAVRSSYLIYELGFTDRRGILNLYEEVLQEMFQEGLFRDIGLLMKSEGGYSQMKASGDIFEFVGTTPTYTIKDFDMKKKKVKLKRNRSAKTYLRMTQRKDIIGAYKPTFLTLHDDTKKVAFTIDYYKLTHGYVMDFMVYLGSIHHRSVEGNRFKIMTCSVCGKRELIMLDGKKGKMPKYCEECGTPKAKMRRIRQEDKEIDEEVQKMLENVTIEN